jgi:2-phosphoglycerate kinase
MSEDNIISLVSSNDEAEKSEFNKRSREAHSFIETFLSYNEAVDFVENTLEQYDDEKYYVAILEIRNINHAYQAGLQIFKRQYELFDD